MSQNSFNTKKLAFSGIVLAFTMVTLFLASILPTSRLSLYALSSFFIAVVIMEAGVKAGWAFYAASCLLAAVILPNKISVLPFVLFFGIYGIVKLYVEKLNRLIPEFIIKLVYFNVCLTSAVLFIRQFLFMELNFKLPWWAIIPALEVIFVVYDYVYTLFIQYYRKKIRKMIRL